MPIPHGHGKADELMPIAESGDAIFIPAICTRSRLIKSEITPRIAIRTVVLANCAPRALAEVRPPALPVDFAILVFD